MPPHVDKKQHNKLKKKKKSIIFASGILSAQRKQGKCGNMNRAFILFKIKVTVLNPH